MICSHNPNREHKRNVANATFILASALVLLTSINVLPVYAQHRITRQTPKLIIGIAVDQLRTDHLIALQNKFGEGGFKRLLNEGLVYENITFNLDNPESTTALAVLATGTYPFYNGISSATVYNKQMMRRQSVFFDKQYIGNTTSGNYSPKALIGTTIGDELKAASLNMAKIYSIAPNAEDAIIGAGHAANCAIWLDDKTGKWATTTYYKDFPQYVVLQNYEQPLFTDINKASWKPTYIGGSNQLMPYGVDAMAFNHSFTENRRIIYQWIKTSPLINDAILELSKLFIKNGRIGLGSNTDMLQLTFYAGTYQNETIERYADELQDIYVKLDHSIAELLKYVDSYIGLSNTIIYLTGTGDTNQNTKDIEGTLQGEFNGARCSALLNSYLISLYGQGNWVDAFDNNQIYLNHKTIEDKKLRVNEVQTSSAEFVAMFSGVNDVVTAHQILNEDYSQRITRMRNAYNKTYGGDLLIELQPGWTLRANDASPAKPQVRHDVAPGPAIIFAPERITPKHITAPIDATVIAPTIAKFIKIRAPSGANRLPETF